MAAFDLAEHPHRRFNPLTREWILVSPHRTKRPWLGQVEKPAPEKRPSYDPKCYLCPGNERAGGVRNPQYTGTFVFDNDFAALLPDTPTGEYHQGDLLLARSERGICRVVCFSPDHSLTLPQMPQEAIRKVVDVWVEQYEDLGARPFINYVQIFENKGQMMGCSNPHPHGQIWSNETIPHLPALEQASLQSYLEEKGHCLLCEYLALERSLGERIVCENEHFVALVPFWAVWPYETMVLSRRHLTSLSELSPEERDGLANIIKRLTTRYDNLFETSFPYSMGFHQAPTDGQPHPEWHLHMHFYPPLLRSATVKKFMVGYEMLANPQRDLTAEAAAERLRNLSEVRFDQRE
ncbi:MAG: UDP-glucose--hexose-1-phosphate uridylyltransferase [Anaerolineae bacterium]|nr:UDP-glucose--hexose-1-phosphate uridylyltransferase [Anaerolineae bacterium]